MSTIEERRARKAERRIEQRRITILRAGKMHNARMLAEAAGTAPATSDPPPVNIGCSGWFYWHLKGSFYPTQMPTKEWFAHYAEHFSTVELNAPFYSWPTLRTVEAWRKQAEGRDMIYTVKVSELITHIRKFEDTETLVRDFGYIADLLGQRMGCFLFQLPPSYHYSEDRLRAILGQLDRRVAMWSSFGMRAGGRTKSIAPLRMRARSSARAAVRSSRTFSSRQRTTSMFAFTA